MRPSAADTTDHDPSAVEGSIARSVRKSSPMRWSNMSADRELLAGTLPERSQIDGARPKPYPGRLELGDAGRVDEDPPSLYCRNEAQDARGLRSREHDHHILQTPDGLAVSVEQRQAHQARDERRRSRHSP